MEDGVVIFSKIPIVDSGKHTFDQVQVGESIAYADILFKNRKLRLHTTHLLSMSLFNSNEIAAEGRFINYNKAYFVGKSRYRPLRLFDSIHAKQAEITRDVLDKSPYPVIMTGDFNSVPSSYVSHKIRGILYDAFVEKGRWFGTSFPALSPTLRIDYIFTDPAFRVKQFVTPKLFLSDHFPVIADIEWVDKK
jgi:endonuclease/exonuclease/phosphatase family metal-dependent hydrolase